MKSGLRLEITTQGVAETVGANESSHYLATKNGEESAGKDGEGEP
jgi:hypothetical protein